MTGNVEHNKATTMKHSKVFKVGPEMWLNTYLIS